MGKLQLTYFDCRGIAERLRLLLIANGIDFEDIRMKDEDWDKSKSPYGTLPFAVTEDGKIIGQTVAIEEYIVHKYELEKDFSEDDRILSHMVIEYVKDMALKGAAIRYFTEEVDQPPKIKDYAENYFPLNAKNLAKMVARKPRGLVTGNKASRVDCYLLWLHDFLAELDSQNTFLAEEAVKIHIEAVKKDPLIAAYLAKRPVTSL